MRDFFSMTRLDLEQLCLELGIPPIHAANLYRVAYKSLEAKPWLSGATGRVTAFPTVLKNYWHEAMPQADARSRIKVVEQHRSGYDQSVKFLLELSDGERIEAVLMPEAKRLTLCLSSQVGCRQGCVFCHTGRMGLKRNLSADEIVGQVSTATVFLRDNPQWLRDVRLPATQKITNIVFMGMGEPLDNVDEVARALTILTDPFGFAIAMRRISVSTAGHLEGIERMIAMHPDVRFAISVHATTDTDRSRIMPINRKWPLEQVLERLRQIPSIQQNGVLLQYTLIRGVNDDLSHAARLVTMTAGLNAKVNLIPLNKIGPSRLEAPTDDHIRQFRQVFHDAGVRVMVRYSKGQDIAAACGQLVNLQ